MGSSSMNQEATLTVHFEADTSSLQKQLQDLRKMTDNVSFDGKGTFINSLRAIETNINKINKMIPQGGTKINLSQYQELANIYNNLDSQLSGVINSIKQLDKTNINFSKNREELNTLTDAIERYNKAIINKNKADLNAAKTEPKKITTEAKTRFGNYRSNITNESTIKEQIIKHLNQQVQEAEQALKDKLAGAVIKDGQVTKSNGQSYAKTNKNFTEIQNYQNLYKNLKDESFIEKEILAWKEYSQKITEAKNNLIKLQEVVNKQPDTKQLTVGQFSNTDIGKDIIDWSKFNDNSTLIEVIQKMTDSISQEEIQAGNFLEKFKVQADEASNATLPLKDNLNKTGDSFERLTARQEEIQQFTNRLLHFFSLTNGFNLLRRSINQAISTIKDLDAVMTEAAVVTENSVSDMWNALDEYADRANQLGVTIHDAYESVTLFLQQGLSMSTAIDVSNESLKLSRIAGLDAAEATDRLTNAMRGFNMEVSQTSAERVNDVYSTIAAKTASDVDELSVAMTKVASLAASANMGFENTAAFLGKIIKFW